MENVLLKNGNALKALENLHEGYPVTLLGEGRQVVLSTSGEAGDYRFVADVGLPHGGHHKVTRSRFELLVSYLTQRGFADLQSISF